MLAILQVMAQKHVKTNTFTVLSSYCKLVYLQVLFSF